ncbi:beta-lactamase [Teladorsagia circumcincta]|uniref:Beta-lactamase n=1 Tax=Teladorsagia circumcincta TaxID=45464 RepID=A0A2G9U7N8_TELCI|nr:beta-lactamase [Teladorsagia circumcincta]
MSLKSFLKTFSRSSARQNFRDGWEPEGASFAVFVKGRKVVDLWGGYADKQAARTWKEDTITVTFSATKAVAAVCIAMLADRGRLKYDDLVSKHWPGFAKNGKGNITIEWVLSHMSALPYLDTQITEEMARDHNLMRKVLEKEAPKLRAGEDNAYHAYTYGWLVDQIWTIEIILTPDFQTDLMMGHPGHGCQQVMFDMKNRVAFAYVTNGLKLGIYDLCRNYARLQKALYDVLDAQAV